jgi:Protein of unknown function (DUF433)
MAEALPIDPIPLVSGSDGVMRVRGTRVTLETVLSAFAEGATAEEIVQLSVNLVSGRVSGNWILSAASARIGALSGAAAPGDSRYQSIQ